MDESTLHFETLKQILRQVRHPELLNDHPWTHSLIVQEALDSCPHLTQASPGQQLIAALAGLFPQLQPATPPRNGKRLDPRWGEFGLLAALYFTPFNHGTPFPTSLLDAWARIDCAILHFVFREPAERLSAEQIQKYELVGDDVEYGSTSTLSDWHKKGLQRFTEITLNRERYLSMNSVKPSVILDGERPGTLSGSVIPDVRSTPNLKSRSVRKRILWFSLGFLLIAALGLGLLKARKIYDRALPVYEDVSCLQQVIKTQPDLETLDTRCSSLFAQIPSSSSAPKEVQLFDRVVPVLTVLQTDLAAFKEEARLVLQLSPKLQWIPVYGNDIASAPALIELVEHLLDASLLSAQALDPMVHEFRSGNSHLNPAGLTTLLVDVGPQIGNARAELNRALDVRKTISADHLSPRLRSLILDELDPRLNLADEGLSLVQALPGLLGAGSEGPKTYLVLVENEDELRPTGGFISSIGNLVVHNGSVIQLSFEDSGEQEDWSKPYPAAPWQLQEYMNSRVLILRDANWFSDFPTAALWAEYLYAYTHDHSVDGVIAFDQHFLIMLLEQLGPLELEGVPYPITTDNVVEYMRQAKQPPPGDSIPSDWTRKAFIAKLADAMLTKIMHGDHDWSALAQAIYHASAERHLLLQFDDPMVSSLIAERGWDGAVQPAGGDFLLVTDTNIGFNKTNAVVDIGLTYDIDLSDLDAPIGTVTLTHKNNADEKVPCIHWDSGDEITGEDSYPINRCYWNYLRVYKQSGVQLLDAAPHAIPGDWMILNESIPARVDELGDEEIAGAQTFGTLLVVPGGETLSTSFRFALPKTVLSSTPDSNEFTLHLHIQKQPGTLENPLTIRVHLPANGAMKLIPPGAIVQNDDLMLKTTLRTDVELDVVFTIP